jgi:hypothetical protein
MGKSPNRRARRQVKFAEPKGLSNELERSQHGSTSEEIPKCLTFPAPVLGDAPTTAGYSKRDTANNERKETEHRMRILVALWSGIVRFFGFVERHHAIVTTLATLAIAALTYSYVGYSKKQWQTMQESNQFNREALISVQRAFVSLAPNLEQDTITGDFKGTHRVVFWRFRVVFDNGGATPATNAHQWTNWMVGDIMPNNFPFVDRPSGGRPVPVPDIIGPKASAGGTEFLVTAETIAATQLHKSHLYFYGWVTYRDIFHGTPTHVTMFCKEVAAIMGDPFAPGKDHLFETISCPRHNCTDEQCDGEPNDPRKK